MYPSNPYQRPRKPGFGPQRPLPANANIEQAVKVMVDIIRYQHTQYSRDVREWKLARQAAINPYSPDRTQLYGLYEDIKLDPFISGIVEARILRVKNKPFIIRNKDGKPDEEKTKLLKKLWFRDFIQYAIESKFEGFSLPYFVSGTNGILETRLVYRENVRPEYGLIVVNPGDVTGYNFNEAPYSNYCIPVGKIEDIGLYDKCALMYILKKHSWQNWDRFEEIFGIPIRIAKTASQDKRVQAEIENWLKDMGTASYGVFPSDAEMDIKENNGTDAFEVFDAKRKAANEELEILLTGMKRHTQTGGTYGKEKVQQEEGDEIVTDDMVMTAMLINEKLMPMLRSFGYQFAEDDEFAWDDTENLTQEQKLKMYQGVVNLGYEVDQADVERDLGIKIIGKKPETQPEPMPGGRRKTDPKARAEMDILAMHKKINELYFNI